MESVNATMVTATAAAAAATTTTMKEANELIDDVAEMSFEGNQKSSSSLWQLVREDCEDIVESDPAPPLKWGPQNLWKDALRAYAIASEAEKRMDDMLFFVSATAYSWSDKEGDSKRGNADIRTKEGFELRVRRAGESAFSEALNASWAPSVDWRATFLLDCILQMKYTARVELWTASTLKAARQGGDPPAKPLQVVERPVFASPARAKREEDGGNNNISNFESTYPKINFSISENATDSEDTLITQSSDESVCVRLTAHSHFSNVETEILMFAGMVSYNSVCNVTLTEEKGTRKRSQSGEEGNVHIKLTGPNKRGEGDLIAWPIVPVQPVCEMPGALAPSSSQSSLSGLMKWLWRSRSQDSIEDPDPEPSPEPGPEPSGSPLPVALGIKLHSLSLTLSEIVDRLKPAMR